MNNQPINIERLKQFVRQKPMIAYPIIGVGILAVAMLLMPAFENKDEKVLPYAKKDRDIGLSVGGRDQQAYLMRIEKNYYEFEDRIKSMEKDVKGIKNSAKTMKNKQDDLEGKAEKMQARLKEEQVLQAGQVIGSEIPSDNGLELDIAQINPLDSADTDSVYLPLGSFVKGTLLTGVYASADLNNPLPVLISIDEYFVGPNQTRVPLKGAFILGKAFADMVSERAYIQVIGMSSVFPDGHAFERSENLGYITDEYGELGIHGQVIRNTGRQLALSFMGGFAAGGSQALADGEVTTSENALGGTTRRISGDGAKNAVFAGLANSAGRMAEYYEKQAEEMVPAIHVTNGKTVYFIVQKGVSIDGLPRAAYSRPTHLD